ncbi:MAG: family 10 glycosylhydrolase [Bacteroidota bacterium]
MMHRSLLLAVLGLLLGTSVTAQPQKHEFRGAWIATVVNLDWPSCTSCPPATQQAELVTLLEDLQATGVNAVVFQVRTEADALYDSPFEPWSFWLTGSQGTAPDPFYDPLAFAIEEAHKRGMELHAWINPYRADRGSDYPKAASHVTNAHPEWILSFSSGISILDPGLPEVRDHVASVVGDIARRYDIDGLHYDDYFYPYPSGSFSGISNEDDATFAAHPRGFTDQGDWRRDNVNLLVAQIQDTLQAVRPEAVHGVSPFGIWKNGTPSGVSGLDAFDVIYADAVAWMNAQTIDYLAPQLYWSSQQSLDTDGDGRPDRPNRQRFTRLAPWWASVRNDRHVYPGLGAYRIGTTGYGATEIPTQIRITRANDDIDGTVLFRPYDGLFRGNLGLDDSLRTNLYRTPALPPPMPWRSQDAPGTPTDLETSAPAGNQSGAVPLSWQAPTSGDAEARFYAVYRIPPAEAGDLATATAQARSLAGVTGETTFTDAPPGDGLYTYVVTAVSPNSVESAPSNAVQAQGATASEPTDRLAFGLLPPRPNPASGPAEIQFTLRAPASVTLRVVDALGREVARLLDDAPHAADTHAVVWRREAGVGSGTYFVVLDAGGERITRPLTVVR